MYIARSNWYRNIKSKLQRFYFGVPKQFDATFLKSNKTEIPSQFFIAPQSSIIESIDKPAKVPLQI